ncbi:hypothetical protein LCGC14_1718270 [marine sediment metagenome]|uniref:Transcription initiation factor IIB n=1 Tax=marine sediment metagenome TaxID=412755 RepID=A0A0F9HDH0_9ZZZZ
MAKKDIGVGVIGVGMGSTMFPLNRIESSRFEVRGICSQHEDKLKKLDGEWGFGFYTTDYKELIKRKDIARCYRLLVKELDLKMPVTDSIQCVARIASRIGITEKTKRYAIKVLKQAQKNEVSAGKDPMGLAAAALYLSCVKNGEDKTQRDIAEAANVTEVTIRNRYKGLKEHLDL